MPPGLVKKSRSFLSNGSSDGLMRNPFLGSSKSSLTRRKKVARDPFADETDGAVDMDTQGTRELSQEDIDDFYEIERPDSMSMTESEPVSLRFCSLFDSKCFGW